MKKGERQTHKEEYKYKKEGENDERRENCGRWWSIGITKFFFGKWIIDGKGCSVLGGLDPRKIPQTLSSANLSNPTLTVYLLWGMEWLLASIIKGQMYSTSMCTLWSLCSFSRFRGEEDGEHVFGSVCQVSYSFCRSRRLYSSSLDSFKWQNQQC